MRNNIRSLEGVLQDLKILRANLLRPCDRCGKPPATKRVREVCSECGDVLLCQKCFTLHIQEVEERDQ